MTETSTPPENRVASLSPDEERERAVRLFEKWTGDGVHAHVAVRWLTNDFFARLLLSRGATATRPQDVSAGRPPETAGAPTREQDAIRVLEWMLTFGPVTIRRWDHDGRRMVNGELLVHKFAGRGGADESVVDALVAWAGEGNVFALANKGEPTAGLPDHSALLSKLRDGVLGLDVQEPLLGSKGRCGACGAHEGFDIRSRDVLALLDKGAAS